jgi:hypothetical protein
VTAFILMVSKNIFSAIMFFILHHGKRKKTYNNIGRIDSTIEFIGMIITGSIVIQDPTNNNLTPNGYPKTAILGISVYSFEYAFLFIIIFVVFLVSGGWLQ